MPRRDLLILGAITLAAAAVRFATLDLQSFHHDEAVTVREVLAPGLADTLDQVVRGERSPPLYYVLAWGWSQLFGTGEAGIRSLSALIGTLMVPAAFLAGRELVSRRVGLFAAAFVALNPYLVWYSQEARSYGLMVLFTVVALAFLARSIREPSPRALAGWGLFSALAFGSHYFAGFLIVAEAALLLALVRPLTRPLIAMGAVFAVGLALLPLALEQQGGDRRDGFADRSLAVRTGEVALNYVASEEPDPLAADAEVDALQIGAAAAAGLVFLLAVGLIIRRGTPREREGALVAGVVAAGAIALPVLMAVAGVDFVNPRNLVAGLPPILILGAIGFGGDGGGRLGLLGAAATCALFASVVAAVNVSEQMQRKDWREAAEAMAPSATPRIMVVPRNGDDPLAYYLGAEQLKGRLERGVRVRAIDVLSTTFEIRGPRGFRLVERRRLAPPYVLWRYEASRVRLVRRADVAEDSILRERSAVLIEAPG